MPLNGLGDAAAAALFFAGITPSRVEFWIGKPCGCEERQRKLNVLGWWTKRLLAGKTEGMREHLERMMGDDDESQGP